MRTLTLLALSLPFGPAQQAPSESWSRTEVAGLALLTGPADTKIGLSGVTSTMPVRVANGEGTLTLRQGLTRDVSVVVKDADVRAVAGLFDLPAVVKSKLTGRVGLVTLTVKGDALTLTATGFRGMPGDPVGRIEATADLKTRAYKAKVFAFGGLLTAEGTLPTGE